MRARLAAVTLLFALAGGAFAVHALTRRATAPRPPVWRLAERLAEARRVPAEESVAFEALHLQPGTLEAPPGWRLEPAEARATPVVARLVADEIQPLRVRIDVPIDGGREYVVTARLRDPAGNARLLIERAPNLEQPTPGWHKASEQRSADRVRFDWREDVPPGKKTQALLLEADAARELTIESLTVREAGVRDPSIVESGAGAALHGLVERPVEGVRTVSPHGARRLEPSLLSAADGVYEWVLPSPPPVRFEAETALVPRGAPGQPLEMRVELDGAHGWSVAWQDVRGLAGDGGGWKPVRIELPRDARAIRLRTTSQGSGHASLGAWGNPTLRDQAPRHPHVLLITLDAVRPDHLGAYDPQRHTSPFIDSLAARGARFLDVSAQRGHTWASTTSLVEGLYPDSSGVVSRGARPYRGTRGAIDAFAAAGYTTGRIGSPDLPRGQMSGFDFAELGEYDNDIFDRLVALGRAYQDRPLFLWVHLQNAHYPWRGISKEEFRDLENFGLSEANRERFGALYDGAIEQMDAKLGRAMAQLEQAGLFADAVIAVSADHGTHTGEHDVWYLHSTPWHACLKVPLILVAPGRVPAGLAVPAERGRALLVDLGPTLLDLAGVPGDGLDGLSLRPLLSGGRLAERTTVTHFQPAGYTLVENDRYELLYNPKSERLAWPGELTRTYPLPAIGLWDRVADPNEEHDLSAEKPEITAALRAQAEAHPGAAAPALSSEARQLLQQAGYAEEK